MSGPLINVFTYTIKPGKQEEARKRIAELVDFVETNEPRMIAFHAYLDQDGSPEILVRLDVFRSDGTRWWSRAALPNSAWETTAAPGKWSARRKASRPTGAVPPDRASCGRSAS